MPTHNLSEVIDACIAYIENNDIDIEELMTYVKAPDFPTGDVYKRQAQRCAFDVSHVRDGDNHFIICIEVFRIEFFWWGDNFRATFVTILLSVSYTHLDVYKRQLLNSGMQDEKDVQDKVKKQQVLQGGRLEKDW